MTSNCAGTVSRLHAQQQHRLRRGELPARLRDHQDAQPLRRRHLHREAARVRRLCPGRLPGEQQADPEPGRALRGLRAVGRGRRPAVELRRVDRASSWWRRTTPSSTASTSAATCRPTRRATSARGSASPTTSSARAARSSAAASGMFWNFTPGRHVVVEGAEPAVPAVDGAHGLAQHELLAEPQGARTACRRRRASTRTARPSGTTRSIFDINFRDGIHPSTGTSTSSSSSSRTTWSRWPTSGAQGRQIHPQGRPERGAGHRGRHELERQPAVRHDLARPCARSARCRARASSTTTRLLVKFQRRFANGFSLLNAYTFAKAIDYNSDNDGTVTVPNVYNIAGYNYAARRLRHHAHAQPERDVRAAVGAGEVVRRLADERHPATAATGFRSPVTQTQGVQSTGHRQPPNTIGDGTLERPHHRQVVRPRLLRSRPPTPPAPTATPAATSLRGPGSFNIDMSLIKNTRIGRVDTRAALRGVQRPQPPAVQQPRTPRSATPPRARSRSMLTNPACSLCGTTERNIQFAAKLTF